jgi:thioredoxin-like negative regulator of GroEL
VVLEEPDTDWKQLPLRGSGEEIAALFRDLPYHQLVILGEAGAGKSIMAILLTLGLIKDPEPGQPTPVLLPITSWNPAEEQVQDFLIRRLTEEYRELAERDAGGSTLAKQLVTYGKVMPVFDGLDELPATLHSKAIQALDLYASRGRPIVATCRTREYEQAVSSSGSVISRSAVIEIEKVTVDQAAAFLSHPAPGRPRWQPVFDYLYEHRDSPLAKTLSTPLMVSLARAAYRGPSRNPAELIKVPDSATLAASLIDGFVYSVYDNCSSGSRRVRGVPSNSYKPDHAARWLSCLAYHLYLAGTRDLCWWRLTLGFLSPRPYRAKFSFFIARSLVVGIVGLTVSLTFGPETGAWAAVTSILILSTGKAGTFRSIWPSSYPPSSARNYRPPRRRYVNYIGIRMAFGIPFGLLVGLLADTPILGLTGGLAFGLVAIGIPKVVIGVRRQGIDTFEARISLLNALNAGFHAGVLSFIIFTILAKPNLGIASALTSGATAAVVYALAAAFSAGLWVWTEFRAAHLLLAMHGWLPWRLRHFLEDAQSRGVLRRAGTTWQFRHALLQDHLARGTHLENLRARTYAGDRDAMNLLASLVGAEETATALRTRAHRGDRYAAERLAELLEKLGRAEEAIPILQAHANAGDNDAAGQLAKLFVQLGRIDELQARADDGDQNAARALPDLLEKLGRAQEAITAFHAHVDTGDWYSARRLAELLGRQGRSEEAAAVLRVHVNAGDDDAAGQLAKLLVELGRIDELQARADDGDDDAAGQLAKLFVKRGQAEEAETLLRDHLNVGQWDTVDTLVDLYARNGHIDRAIAFLYVRADAGSWNAAHRLADLLEKLGRPEEAIVVLRTHAEGGDGRTIRDLADLLIKLRRPEEALAVLRVHADTGDWHAAYRLADLLAEQGRPEEAIPVLEICAVSDNVSRDASRRLATLLRELGQVEKLRDLAESDNYYGCYAGTLASLLAELGRVDELRARANNGDRPAAYRLADLLAEQGRPEEALAVMQARVNAGDRYAAYKVADLLANLGRAEEALAIPRSRADAGDSDAAHRLANLLARLERVDELRARADNGDAPAAYRLADLLEEQGRPEEAIPPLRALAHGNPSHVDAAHRLTELLVKLRGVDELQAYANDGNIYAARALPDLLVELGRVDELRARADNGDAPAAYRLADLLEEQCRPEEAILVLQGCADAGGYAPANRRLVELLVKLERVDELHALADNGDRDAARALTDLLAVRARRRGSAASFP